MNVYSHMNFTFLKSLQWSWLDKQLHWSRRFYHFGQYCITHSLVITLKPNWAIYHFQSTDSTSYVVNLFLVLIFYFWATICAYSEFFSSINYARKEIISRQAEHLSSYSTTIIFCCLCYSSDLCLNKTVHMMHRAQFDKMTTR